MRWIVAVRRKITLRLALGVAIASGLILAWVLVSAVRRPPAPVPPLAWLSRPSGGPHLIMAGGVPDAPPDTLPAFRQALKRGATALLLPVRFTGDGEPVVCAPADLAAVTEGRGPIGSLPLDEVQRLDAGYRFSGRRQDFPFRGHGLQIPHLEQVFAAFPGVPALVDVVDPAPSAANLKTLARIVQRWGGEALVLFRLPAAAATEFRAALPDSAAVSTPGEATSFRRLARLGLHFLARPSFRVLWLSPGRDQTTPGAGEIKAAQQAGLLVIAGPVTKPDEATALAEAGVDALLVSGSAARR